MRVVHRELDLNAGVIRITYEVPLEEALDITQKLDKKLAQDENKTTK